MKKQDAPKPPIRPLYDELGVDGYYAQHGGEYRNPHEPIVRLHLAAAVDRWSLDLGSVLDLACGSGEVTLCLRELGALAVQGIDPYTCEAYCARTGNPAEALSFEQIARGALAGRRHTLIVCSFAMHLIDTSWLPALLSQLALVAPRLLILTPHKRPSVRPAWGWRLVDEIHLERVRTRIYAVHTP